MKYQGSSLGLKQNVMFVKKKQKQTHKKTHAVEAI